MVCVVFVFVVVVVAAVVVSVGVVVVAVVCSCDRAVAACQKHYEIVAGKYRNIQRTIDQAAVLVEVG